MIDIAYLEAYVAISQVKAQYCRALDTKDWVAYGDVFTDDVELDTRPAGGTVSYGRDEALRIVRSAVGSSSSTPTPRMSSGRCKIVSSTGQTGGRKCSTRDTPALAITTSATCAKMAAGELPKRSSRVCTATIIRTNHCADIPKWEVETSW
jgi:hypothetical protein